MVPLRSQSHAHSQPQPQPQRQRQHPDDADTRILTATFPIHPLPSMQAAFEESMLDATGQTGHVPFAAPTRSVKARQQLLCRDDDAKELAWNASYACHWRHYPKGNFHPLLKTAAQIVFGVHLLHQRMQKSVAHVADILLNHVNELDGFLQRANDDIETGLKDMLFRRKCLKVPMEHVNEFDRLLEDRTYRAQLLDGNIVIQRTTTRMSTLLDDHLADMAVLRDANQRLHTYLQDIGQQWTRDNDDIARIYSAMCGNTGGWSQFLQSLAAKAEKLGAVLVQVTSYCNEIDKRCGAASRRSLIATRSSSRNSSNSRDNSRAFRRVSNNKPLPTVPSEPPPSKSSSPASTSGPLSQTPVASRPSTIRTISQSHSDSHMNSSYTETRKRNQDSAPSSMACDNVNNVNIDMQHQAPPTKPNHCTQEPHKRATPQAEPHTSRPGSVPPKLPTIQTQLSSPQQKGDKSPIATYQDSAYFSVSGMSAASPILRPDSSLSSPPQFGFFPTTANHSNSSNHTAENSSSISCSNTESTTALPRCIPDHSAKNSSAMEGVSKRLNKRSSFSSFKQLFGRKKKKEKMGDIVE